MSWQVSWSLRYLESLPGRAGEIIPSYEIFWSPLLSIALTTSSSRSLAFLRAAQRLETAGSGGGYLLTVINPRQTLLQAIDVQFPLALRIQLQPELLYTRIPRILTLSR